MVRAALERAVRVLRAGGIVAYPTEAVYGLGCDPRNRRAVERLLALKRRPRDLGLILIAAGPRQLEPFIRWPDAATRDRVLATWPGPVTWVLPARFGVPQWLRGRHAGLAVRVTGHPPAAQLCRRFAGALVSTSANVHGRQPVRRAADLPRALRAGIDYVLEGSTGGRARCSEIRDALSGRVLRPG